MHRLAFLSRVAFICNVSLVLAWLLRYIPFARPDNENSFFRLWMEVGLAGFIGMVLAMGLALSFIMNPLVNILYAVALIRRRPPLRTLVPVWLATINFLFLIIQLYLVIQ